MYETISYDKAHKVIKNLFSSLRIINRKFKLNFELLKDPSSDEDLKDLIAIFGSANENDQNSSRPNIFV